MKNIEKINNNEEEAKILDIINLAVLKREGRDKIEISDMVKDFAEDLPEELKIQLENYYKDVEREAKGIVDNFFDDMPEEMQNEMSDYREKKEENVEADFKLKEKVKRRGREIRESFMDQSLKLPNQAYSKLDLISKIDETIEEDPTPEGLKKVAYVSFDLNGLKSVNDLNSGAHAFGDEYLKLAAEAIGSKETREIARENGFDANYIVTRNGGDEFGVILKSDEPIEPEALNNFIWQAQDALWNNEKVSNVLDFDNPKVLANFAGVDIEEVKKYNSINEFKDKYNIPRGYKYKGAISAGASRLYDALLDKANKDKNGIEKGDSYEKIVKKIMGSTLGTGDRRMDKNKKSYKAGLANGEVGDNFPSEEEKQIAIENAIMLSRVYVRTAKEKELLENNQKLKEENEKLIKEKEEAKEREKQLADDIKALIEAGGSAKDVLRIIERRN